MKLKFKREGRKFNVYFAVGITSNGLPIWDYVYRYESFQEAEKDIKSAFENNGNMVGEKYMISLDGGISIATYTYEPDGTITVK